MGRVPPHYLASFPLSCVQCFCAHFHHPHQCRSGPYLGKNSGRRRQHRSLWVAGRREWGHRWSHQRLKASPRCCSEYGARQRSDRSTAATKWLSQLNYLHQLLDLDSHRLSTSSSGTSWMGCKCYQRAWGCAVSNRIWSTALQEWIPMKSAFLTAWSGLRHRKCRTRRRFWRPSLSNTPPLDPSSKIGLRPSSEKCPWRFQCPEK